MFSVEHYRALREGAGLLDRSSRGRLRLTGEDRRSYLQGLLSNDIAALTPGSGCYATLLTAQGRMVSDMYVMETGDAIVMDLEREVTPHIAAHLDRFVITEDVTVADESDRAAQLGVYGPGAAAVVAAALGPEAPAPRDLEQMPVLANRTLPGGESAVLIVRRDDVGVAGFDVMVAAHRADRMADALRRAGAVAVDHEAAEVVRVEAGRPAFLLDMTSDTIPLEAGIEDRAISLTKGCYVGQEIIIRVLHRGHGRVARRLVGLVLDSGAAVPAHGDRIRAGDREIGSVTSAVRSPALERAIALGYVHRDFAAPGTRVSIAGHAGAAAPAVVHRLPFVGGLTEPATIAD
jgi:folate-binding protein YgfZ